MREISVAFAGNPNCGKTTLFNAYTGARLKTANWPGVTVEKKEGRIKFNADTYKLVDLPGTYSLTSYTMEEKLTRQYLTEEDAQVIIDVADASSLERNLYLTLQLTELGKPVVLALNMMDIVEERGMKIDVPKLCRMLGIPVVPVSARKRTGLGELMQAAARQYNDAKTQKSRQYVMVYSDEIERKLNTVAKMLEQKYPDIQNKRWHAIKLLEHDEQVLKEYPIDLSGIAKDSLESEIVNQKYEFIEKIISEVLVNKEQRSAATDCADKILTNGILGVPVFFMIMAAVFFLTFAVGNWIKGFFEGWIESFSFFVRFSLVHMGASKMLVSLTVDGIIAGVGGVLTFLPNIFILFLSLAFLEDSGYMSRVAYVMDGIMGKIGLSGRAFIPMLLGFGCSVPAIMASRALENEQDRRKTMLVTPFMSCSARLPVYVMLSGTFFGKYAMLAAYSMYVIGVFAAVIVLFVMSKLQKCNDNDLLIELPEYKTPNARTIAIYVWEKIADYLQKAGTTIFVASVILWFVLNFGPCGMTADMKDSFAAAAGRSIAPLLAPAGLGYWQIAVSLLSGIAAKEVVVSSMGVLFSVTNTAAPEGQAALCAALSDVGFTAVNAYSMMLFCLLYVPCIAALAAMRKESGSLRFTVCAAGMQLTAAWCISSLFYQIAIRIF